MELEGNPTRIFLVIFMTRSSGIEAMKNIQRQWKLHDQFWNQIGGQIHYKVRQQVVDQLKDASRYHFTRQLLRKLRKWRNG